ncbi:DUF11 domain-containing protein [Sphingorhabdus sp. IMCC26285]|uniref:DUF11 domain-containing protein n=1 Tax=Sphingorhabdus profundilacus TaxID=2509718 RepID=A0A6I4LS85_9SPHN|nr:proprotein convertase P-domain-containing protein [Sphingorhabdus profundilacus]MVZ96267.1 DUF11 domain-containing protein [Sphingorhabdus profundilacus]
MVIYGDRIIWRWLRTVFFAMALWAGWSSPGFAQTVISYTNSVDGNISETLTPCANPLNRIINVPEIYTIADINIGVLIGHARRNNLIITLTSPAGTSVTLFRNTGGTRSNLNVLFDSAIPTSVNTHSAANDTAAAGTVAPPFQRSFSPVQSLNTFNGENANGNWTLSICDNVAANTGTFFQSTLSIIPLRATLSVTKISVAQFDFVSATNPKSVPGARVRYCITISNDGPGLATTISGTDIIPPNTSYVPNSLRSGTDCASTLTAEDDDAVGADESDPMGASVSGSVLSLSAPTMANAASFALAFLVTVN